MPSLYCAAVNFLFVHQNFPGQFRHVAKALADDTAHRVIGIGELKNLQGRQALHPRVQVFGYEPHDRGHANTHHYVRDFEGHVRRGQSVVRLAMNLREQGSRPDVVVVHSGWGEGIFLRDVFPEARHIHYLEYYYHGVNGDVGFDPEFPRSLDDQLKVRVKNSTQLLGLVACDEGISPTQWQKSRFPAEFQSKIGVMHEGVDTATVRPDPNAVFERDGCCYRAGEEIVTYVARNLEPYRGFHVFMRSLPRLLAERPQARVLIIGGDEVSYGLRLPEGESYRARYCEALRDKIDWSRVHFVGKLPYADYLKVLQVSAVHVYLTYPFVLSWSMLEAMAAGCALVASATSPVMEVVRDGENGRLVDFFDVERLVAIVADVLERQDDHRSMRAQARATVVEHYDLRNRCLPQALEFLMRR